MLTLITEVPPYGDPPSSIVVLGEAPGEEEAAKGLPFIGPSGRLLFDQILARANIRRDQTYTLNVHWQMPPGKKWETIPASELGMYDDYTATALTAYPRKVIVAVGGHALDFCVYGTAKVPKTKALPVTKWRGSILSTSFGAVIPMIHPAAVLRAGGYSEAAAEDDGDDRKGLHYKALCIHDAKRVRQFFDGKIGLPPKRFIHHPGTCVYPTFMTRLENLQGPFSDLTNPIAFDIETNAHTITCIGVSWSDTEAAVVPFTNDEVNQWNRAEQVDAIQAVSRLLDGPNPKIGQHLDYDVQHLARYNIPVRNVWLDTAVAHNILWPEMPHDLATLTSLYTLQPYFKDMREDTKEADLSDPIMRWEYNGLDCCVTREIGLKLDHELRTRVRGVAS